LGYTVRVVYTGDQKREYDRRRIAEARAAWFAGKACAICGSTIRLELDHVDPAVKVSHRVWSWSPERRTAELAKCRALCHDCHRRKSAGEAAKGERAGHAKLTEGDVLAIRASAESCRSLGEEYGVHWVTISKIKRGVKWQHVA
jgi:hypothetical protein